MKFSWAKVVVSVVLVASYFLLPNFGFLWGGTISEHFLYPLSHANVWHLAANLLCLWMIPCELHLFRAYAMAVVCSFLPCFVPALTYGFSGVLFAIVGMSWGRVRRFKDMIWRNKWFLVVPIFIPHVNALLHVYCMVAGYVVGRYWHDGIMPKWKKDWV